MPTIMLDILLMGITPPKPQPIFQPQTKIEKKIKKPLTVEQKIKLNYYKCTSDQYIRRDTAECLDKPKTTAPAQTPTTQPVNSSGNTYEWHSCTWHAKSMRPDLPNNLGNAYSWVANAQAQGIKTGNEPAAGAVGQQGNHVVYIVKVSGDRVYLSERNWDWNGSYRERWANASDFVYIYKV